jgi:predicted ester cyclase
LEVADEILAPDVIIHRLDSFTPDFGTGPEAMKQIVGLYRSTFPDLDVVIDDVIAAGDKLITRFTINGTQKGDLPGIPATGLPISMPGIDIYQIKNGKIVEFWHDADTLGLMKTLGAMPDRQEASALAQNKNTAMRFRSALFNGEESLEVADEIIAADTIIHALDSFTPELPKGPAGAKQLVGIYQTMLSDLHVSIDDNLASGDKVTLRWSAKGKHTGDLPGLPPAAGKELVTTGMDIIRFEDDKIAEIWVNWDTFGMMQQMSSTDENGTVDAATQNEEAVRRLLGEKLWGEGDFSMLDELIAPNILVHRSSPLLPDAGTKEGIDAVKENITRLRTVFSNIQFALDDVFAGEDKVTVRWTVDATQTGDLPKFPASCKPITTNGVDI